MNFRTLIQSIRSRGSKVLVVGLGVSGVETAAFLRRLGVTTVAIEKLDQAKHRATSKLAPCIDELRQAGVELHFGIDGESVGEILGQVELCVLSPGVSLESAICGVLKRRQIQIVSELELGIELLGWPCVMVTGSNGKTTTVTLITQMLAADGRTVRLCGNVGTPVVTELSEACLAGPDSSGVLVVEASSYQLESCAVVKPKVGVLLNVSDNHLERHGTLERYFEIKARLFARQDSTDTAIVNAGDQFTKQLSARLESRVLAFGHQTGEQSTANSPGARIEYAPGSEIDRITIDGFGATEQLSLSKAKLLGRHNRENIAAAALAARSIGVPLTTIQSVVDTFEPLEHRIEHFAEIGGIVWINDSKSTTVAAALADVRAIAERYPTRRLTVMIGGLSKAGSWLPLMQLLAAEAGRLNPVVSFGGDAKLLASHCRSAGVACQVAASLREGVTAAAAVSAPGDVVLLSPGCASFDEFTDYEHRGQVFKTLVRELGAAAQTAV